MSLKGLQKATVRVSILRAVNAAFMISKNSCLPHPSIRLPKYSKQGSILYVLKTAKEIGPLRADLWERRHY